MTFDQIWQQLCRKNEKLNQPETTVEFTAENLRKLLRQVYGQGEAYGRDIGSEPNPFSDLFGM